MVICFTKLAFATVSLIPTAEKKPLQYEHHTRSTALGLDLDFVKSERMKVVVEVKYSIRDCSFILSVDVK